MLSVVMLNVVMLCRYDECRYAECRSASGSTFGQMKCPVKAHLRV
jgi:hypothetical protein